MLSAMMKSYGRPLFIAGIPNQLRIAQPNASDVTQVDQTFPLLLLPREIRDLIYAYAFALNTSSPGAYEVFIGLSGFEYRSSKIPGTDPRL